ncbi:hypothetical protein ACTMU2_37135 [Cupriavidus basilensis]
MKPLETSLAAPATRNVRNDLAGLSMQIMVIHPEQLALHDAPHPMPPRTAAA